MPLTEREMFEKSFQRPRDYFRLAPEVQWEIDKSLGILDWNGTGLSAEDMKRFKAHYLPDKKRPKKAKDPRLSCDREQSLGCRFYPG